QLVTYTVTVTNTGPLAATDVVLTNILSTNLFIVSYNSTAGSCENSGNIIRCDIGTDSMGDFVQASIVARAAVVGPATNRFNVVRTGADPNLNNNSAIEVTSVVLPSIRIQDITVVEGNSGTNEVAVPVYLSGAWTNTISVDYSTGNGSA